MKREIREPDGKKQSGPSMKQLFEAYEASVADVSDAQEALGAARCLLGLAIKNIADRDPGPWLWKGNVVTVARRVGRSGREQWYLRTMRGKAVGA